uniref:Uncharacterized protein n=1 Tax=Sinocyclocheilus rhinocerous TaxID=307959 RepID=A0A673JSX9_9TELE
MTSTIVSGVWRSHANLDESEPDSSPEAPRQFKKITLRSSSSLNSLRMSLRKRLPLKPVQSNVNISETPTWESLQMNQKTSAVHKMTRSAKNSIGSVYQSRQECLVMTPGRMSDGEECDCIGTSQTPKRSAARTTITPRRTPRSTSKRTPRGACTPEASDFAVRTVKTTGTRRQLVRTAALRNCSAALRHPIFCGFVECHECHGTLSYSLLSCCQIGACVSEVKATCIQWRLVGGGRGGTASP